VRQACPWSAIALAALAACAGSLPPATAPVPELPPDEVALSLYLLGDAGAPDPRGEPVLRALSRDLVSGPNRSVVVFLGDNIYPRGLPEPSSPRRLEAERRLTAQIQAIREGRATGFFIPGNHDWDKSGAEGWDAIRRQGAFVDSAGTGVTTFLPRGGCPGPSVVELGRLRLIVLDTQWWLHDGPKPQEADSICSPDVEADVVDSLRSALAVGPGRIAVVAAHHPLSSGGEHGGYFPLEDHIFPLREVVSWLWVPLPWLGSLYPTARQQGISSQDIPSRRYQRLIQSLNKAFATAPPVLYAAGHEHNMQVIKDRPVPLELVIGTGYYGHSGRAVAIEGTQFAKNASGYARLDVPLRGAARLSILEVDSAGRSHEVFSTSVE
jgi:calcineurin-like phosphoesterase family protein